MIWAIRGGNDAESYLHIENEVLCMQYFDSHVLEIYIRVTSSVCECHADSVAGNKHNSLWIDWLPQSQDTSSSVSLSSQICSADNDNNLGSKYGPF